LNIKPCMDQISGTWELFLCEYWRKSMIIGEQNTDLKRLTPTGRLKLRFLTEIGRFHWNQGEEVAHFAWFGEPWTWLPTADIDFSTTTELIQPTCTLSTSCMLILQNHPIEILNIRDRVFWLAVLVIYMIVEQ
jgi:hypothetical protein